MTNPIISEFDVKTGVHSEREMTAAEYADYEEMITAHAAEKAEAEAKAAARQAVLARLNLTEEEAQLILGGSN
jgi:hypothetical protein